MGGVPAGKNRLLIFCRSDEVMKRIAMKKSLLLLLPAVLLAAGAEAPNVKGYKTAGSPMAPVTIELYTDYQCPHCREFYLTVLPQLNEEFIKTGKLRLIHRDFQLPQFQFSKLATRYANAAGEIGKYDVVARQLFVTQPDWWQNGEIDRQVARVLSPEEMEKVRAMVKDDAHLDDTVKQDREMATKDDVHATPTVVIVHRGKREPVEGGISFGLLKQYIDDKLKQ
jgi:protein-disulfide isomerase